METHPKIQQCQGTVSLYFGGVTGESEIAEMWQDHYKSILNSVKNNTRQQFVTNKLDSIRGTGESIMFSTADINVALHSLKSGKSCGVDGLAAEHFMFAHRMIYVFLSLLFNSFILHGYLPSDFMKTAMVPIIKNKIGETSDKNNYRPIALVTAASKLFEFCILKILETYLLTHDYQFGFKAKHSTDICIFTVNPKVSGGGQKSTTPSNYQHRIFTFNYIIVICR